MGSKVLYVALPNAKALGVRVQKEPLVAALFTTPKHFSDFYGLRGGGKGIIKIRFSGFVTTGNFGTLAFIQDKKYAIYVFQ